MATTVRFRIWDGTDGKWLSGVTCSFNGRSKQTGSDGYAIWSNILAGSYSFSVSKSGYTSESGSFTIQPGVASIGVSKTLYATAPPPRFTLSIKAEGGGTTDPAPGYYEYDAGTKLGVLAVPLPGYYYFAKWTLDGIDVGAANPIAVTMNADHELIAHFTKEPAPPPTAPRYATIAVSLGVGLALLAVIAWRGKS